MLEFSKGSVMYHTFGGFSYDYVHYSSIEDANNRLAGRLVVCERVDGDNNGRLRLHKIYARNSIERGNGWYDLFTYTCDDANLKKGFYLCRINEFKVDKKNYVNMVVSTIVYLGESITAVPDDITVRIVRSMMVMDKEEDMPAWQFLCGKMSPIAFAPYGEYFGTFNEENAREKGFTAEDVMSRIINGDIGVLEELSLALHEPLKVEKAKEYIFRNLDKPGFNEKYPLMAPKLKRKEGKEIKPFLEKHLKDYETKQLNVEIPEDASAAEEVLYKVEATLKYWKEVHKAQKKTKGKGEKK